MGFHVFFFPRLLIAIGTPRGRLQCNSIYGRMRNADDVILERNGTECALQAAIVDCKGRPRNAHVAYRE
jgi:hypothetical protein